MTEEELQPKEKDADDVITMSLEEIISELCRFRTWKYTGLVLSLMVTWTSSPLLMYITSFTGSYYLYLYTV